MEVEGGLCGFLMVYCVDFVSCVINDLGSRCDVWCDVMSCSSCSLSCSHCMNWDVNLTKALSLFCSLYPRMVLMINPLMQLGGCIERGGR